MINNIKPGVQIQYQNLEEKYDSTEIGNSLLTPEYFIEYDKDQRIHSRISLKEENHFSKPNLLEKEKFIQTYSTENLISKNGHLVSVRFSHRRSSNYVDHSNSKSEMAEVTSLNRFLNDGINLTTKYSLINEEFYPRISELVYVGDGVGDFDSTGTALEDGDYDKVFTLAGDPELSVKVDFELNSSVEFKRFVKKNTIPIIRDLQWESTIRLSEQSTSSERLKIYIFYPEYFMEDSLSVYSFYNINNTLWWSLFKNKYIVKTYLETSKIQDRRYYDNDVDKELTYGFMLRFNKLRRSQLELNYEANDESDSYYESDIKNREYSAELRTQWTRKLTFTTEIFYETEDGDKQNSSFDYKINSFGVNENVTYYIGRKYRFVTGFNIKQNDRSGSDFLTGLKEKRDGMIQKWKLNINYKVNSFTNANLQYTGERFPEEDTENTLFFKVTASF
jgi:hypothetical protein